MLGSAPWSSNHFKRLSFCKAYLGTLAASYSCKLNEQWPRSHNNAKADAYGRMTWPYQKASLIFQPYSMNNSSTEMAVFVSISLIDKHATSTSAPFSKRYRQTFTCPLPAASRKAALRSSCDHLKSPCMNLVTRSRSPAVQATENSLICKTGRLGMCTISCSMMRIEEMITRIRILVSE